MKCIDLNGGAILGKTENQQLVSDLNEVAICVVGSNYSSCYACVHNVLHIFK